MNTENVVITKQERKYKTLVTDIGNQKITNAVLNGEKVNIVAAAVGDGGGNYYTPTADMTALLNEVWRGPIAGKEINSKSENMLDVKIVIPAKVGGFTIRECGVFDDTGDMIAVCNVPDTEKAIIEDGISTALTVLMHIVMTNNDALQFTLDPSIDTASAVVDDFTITRDVWRPTGEEDTEAAYPYQAEVACDLATAMHTPIVTLMPDSLKIAKLYGLCPTAETVAGGLRFWAMEIPNDELNGKVLLVGQGGASAGENGNYVLPTATPYRLGGVKVGDGLVVDDEGTLSVDAANSDETTDILDEIFT